MQQVAQLIRNAVSYFHPTLEAQMDAKLIAGEIDRRVGAWSAQICRGNPGAIHTAKANGTYYRAFSESPSKKQFDRILVRVLS